MRIGEAARQAFQEGGAQPEIAVRVGRDLSTSRCTSSRGTVRPSRPTYSRSFRPLFLHHYIQ